MEELARYGPTGVALAVVAILFYVIRYTFNELRKSIDKNTKATEINTKMGNETYKFLKTLNGDLKEAIKKKAN